MVDKVLTFPGIISVDDHIVEPRDLWTSRLPKEYADVDKLRQLENVPLMQRCFKSILPSKPKKQR